MLAAKPFTIIFSSCRIEKVGTCINESWLVPRKCQEVTGQMKKEGNDVLCSEKSLSLQTWKPRTEGMEQPRERRRRLVGTSIDAWWQKPSLHATLCSSAPVPDIPQSLRIPRSTPREVSSEPPLPGFIN